MVETPMLQTIDILVLSWSFDPTANLAQIKKLPVRGANPAAYPTQNRATF